MSHLNGQNRRFETIFATQDCLRFARFTSFYLFKARKSLLKITD